MKTKFLQRVLWMVVPLLTMFSTNAWGTTITNQVNTFTSSSTPSGWTVGSTNTHATGYLKMSSGDYLQMTTASVFASGEVLSSNNMTVEVSCGTFGTWTGAKSVLCTVELRNSSNSVLSTANATFSSLNNSETTYRTAINVAKPADPSQIAYLRITFTSFTSGTTLRVKNVRLNYSTAAAATTVTASPTSITFAADELDGSGEAIGSTTLDLSVSNGYKSGGNYLLVAVESDDAECEFTVNSGAYSYGSGNSQSIDDLSVEYYAIDAGTWTGRVIASGYNSSYTAVNCTIPLSVTISAPSCANSVTINAGTNTNCTFTLSKSGAQESCDGVTTTVSITPTTGYGTPVVTESGASSAPTPGGSGNTQTLTYAANTTGTSTIDVSCSANTYTITLNKDLTPTTAGTASITATYNSSSNLTSAITKPTKDGWTFAGYFTAKNGGGTQIIGADGNVIASASDATYTYTDGSKNWKYAGDITLYAKWTCTVTWSVNTLTNVYSTQTVTYNSSGCKVASVPGPPSPATYCGDKFAGWSRKNAGTESKTTSYYDDLFTDVTGSPALQSIGDVTFYAVFADYDDD